MSDFDQWGYPVHRDEPSTPEWSVSSPPTKAEREQERKESELARLRRELEEAESAIRWYHGYDEPGLPDFSSYDRDKRYGWRNVAREIPAVRRAIESGGG